MISACKGEGEVEDRRMLAIGRGARRFVRSRSTVRRKGFDVDVEAVVSVEAARDRIGDIGSAGGDGAGHRRMARRDDKRRFRRPMRQRSIIGKVDSGFRDDKRSFESVVQSVIRFCMSASDGFNLPSRTGTTLPRKIATFPLSAPKLSSLDSKAG